MLADEDLYDEFGNYIGEPVVDMARLEDPLVLPVNNLSLDIEASFSTVVLHENKDYYPSSEQTYGPNVEIKVEDEDRQPLSEPIIAPIRHELFQVTPSISQPLKASTFTPDYLCDSLIHRSERIRNVGIVGALHHGKTCLIDMLVAASHPHSVHFDPNQPHRWTDLSLMSRQRKISMSSAPLTLVLPNSKGQSFILNALDTPGHADFGDEIVASLALCDGIILVIDVLEGITSRTESLLRYIALNKIPTVLFLNKIDRLILELHLPPIDAYHKIKYSIDEINTKLHSCGLPSDDPVYFSPRRGNVMMGSAKYGWLFTLESYSKFLFIDSISLLWGDISYDKQTSKCVPLSNDHPLRTFVEFVLEPIYKLHMTAIGVDSVKQIASILSEVGIYLKNSEIAVAANNSHLLLVKVMQQYFGGSDGLLGTFIDCISMHIPSPISNAFSKVENIYTGPISDDSSLKFNSMKDCDSKGPLMVYVTKLIPTSDAKSFLCLGRIFSGTLRSNSKVRILGEHFLPDVDEEDSSIQTIENVYLPLPSHNLCLSSAPAGCIVLISGSVHFGILKTATIVQSDDDHDMNSKIDPPFVFKRLLFSGGLSSYAVIKLAIEPMRPSELPKMLDGLRNVTKAYPQAEARVEESGEHVIFGPGELYLDSLMHDLRKLYAQIDIRVADPSVRFCETIVETSSLICTTKSPNNKNTISMIAEPLDKGLAEDIESGLVPLPVSVSQKELSVFFSSPKYNWDVLAARSIWAFGPSEDIGPNILLNEIMPSKVSSITRSLLSGSIREAIQQGFQWACREGPLCDEPIRGIKVKLVSCEFSHDPILRGSGQIIPASRRAVYSSFLTASPRLMEPVYAVEIHGTSDCVSAVYTVLTRRRGHVLQDIPRAGTPLYTIKALLPCIESFGFETDLRTHTQGQAFCQMNFDHWQVVPGDPLDNMIKLIPLEPAPAPHLARDFMIKTRRRKGLAEHVSVVKYFDESLLESLSLQEESYTAPGLA